MWLRKKRILSFFPNSRDIDAAVPSHHLARTMSAIREVLLDHFMCVAFMNRWRHARRMQHFFWHIHVACSTDPACPSASSAPYLNGLLLIADLQVEEQAM